jgi:gamma-glutamylcyclotransferase (GGCT)/AIG2-like uncharacterized protein YtfP
MHEVKFFFYGTLMDYEHPNEMIETESERGSALGILYDLGPFPAALFDTGQVANIVYGRMLTFTAPNADLAKGILHLFDGYEGYDEGDLENSLYIRKTVEVMVGGSKHECQTYQFNQFKENAMYDAAVHVPSGNWKKFKEQLREKSDEEDIN